MSQKKSHSSFDIYVIPIFATGLAIFLLDGYFKGAPMTTADKSTWIDLLSNSIVNIRILSLFHPALTLHNIATIDPLYRKRISRYLRMPGDIWAMSHRPTGLQLFEGRLGAVAEALHHLPVVIKHLGNISKSVVLTYIHIKQLIRHSAYGPSIEYRDIWSRSLSQAITCFFGSWAINFW